MRRFFYVGAAWALCCGVARAALSPTVTATVDRTTVSLQDEIVLTVTVDGSRHAQITLPPLAAFNVHDRGQSTQVHIVNGSMSTQVSYVYALTPMRTGTFSIGAVRAMIGANVMSSDPFEVTVTAASMAPTDTGEVMLTAEISDPSPVVGQQIIYIWRLLHRVHIANGRVTLPAFEGFFVQDLGPQKEYQTHINGQQYRVTEMRRALFAQDVGPLTVPGSRLEVDVAVAGGGHGVPGNPFTDLLGQVRHRNRTLTTPPLPIVIRPLPPPPADFSELVGQFSIDAQLSQTSLQVGDSTTLTVTVSGKGNIEHIVEPILGEVPGLKVYSDRPSTELQRQDSGITGSKVFKKALVPTRMGRLEIPSIRLTYFDPSHQSYETTATPIYVVHVAANPHATAPAPVPAAPATPQKTDVKILLDDILPLYRRQDALQPQFSRREKWGLALIFVLPPLGYGAAWLFRRNILRAQDLAALKRRHALKHALAATTAMQKALAEHETRQAATLASRALREFLGNRLNVEGLALTPSEARRILLAQGVAASMCVTVEGLLQRCEAAQYGAPHLGTPGGDSAEELRSILQQLSRILPA